MRVDCGGEEGVGGGELAGPVALRGAVEFAALVGQFGVQPTEQGVPGVAAGTQGGGGAPATEAVGAAVGGGGEQAALVRQPGGGAVGRGGCGRELVGVHLKATAWQDHWTLLSGN